MSLRMANEMLALKERIASGETTDQHVMNKLILWALELRDEWERPDPMSQALNEGDGVYRP